MNRRKFIRYSAFLTALKVSPTLSASSKQPAIAFTFDDPKTESGGGHSWQEINERMLAALSEHHLKAVLFVTGKRVDSDAGRKLIVDWDKRVMQ